MEVVFVSYSTVVLVMAASWLSVGLTLSLIMGRRGHDAFSWLVLGTLFGPLGAIFAFAARSDERVRPELVAARLSSGPGPVDVLVGVDGSPESRAALLAATELLGPRLGRLTLAAVVPYASTPLVVRAARQALESQSELRLHRPDAPHEEGSTAGSIRSTLCRKWLPSGTRR